MEEIIIPVTLPRHIVFVLQLLSQAGYESYLVGGAVRDLMSRDQRVELDDFEQTELLTSTDFDITTNANPEQIMALLPKGFYENDFGTVVITTNELLSQFLEQDTVVIDHLFRYKETATKNTQRVIDLATATKVHQSLAKELPAKLTPPAKQLPTIGITTFRTDGHYQDHRRPASVSWGKTLAEDVDRRDFTINALAMKIAGEEILSKSATLNSIQDLFETVTVKMYDFHQGLSALKDKIITTVGKPEVRFQEDGLRMLRAIRFSVQLNFAIAPATFDAICQHAALIEHISWERIRDEFLKMLASNFPAEAIELLDETGLLAYILPELLECKNVEQGGHHTTDVWTHSLDALRECPSPDVIVRLATLLHDIAKPQTFRRQNRTITFYNHEVIGARVAKSIAQRLKLSKNECDRIFILVRQHMFYYQPHNTDAAIRRFMRKVGLDVIDDILDLREADRLGSGARKTSWRLEEMKQRMIEQLHQPMSAGDLAINGHDLMDELQLKPGPEIGRLLGLLLERVIDDPTLNQRETLLKLARDLVAN